jgi:hypothetical protein
MWLSGKTPVWSCEDAKKLLESIPRDALAGLRIKRSMDSLSESSLSISGHRVGRPIDYGT